MRPFTTLDAVACPLPFSGIDTDQLIPARFMKRSRAEGYGQYLLHDVRFDENGRPKGDFPLDRPEREGTEIIVARRNFGGGSSREAAAYALVDFGIRCVVAPSFGDIFSSNAVNNGLLPARVSEADAETILARLEQGLVRMEVDLEAQTVAAGDESFGFEVDPVWRMKLLNGWDDLDLTQSYGEAIAEFAREDAGRRPWMPPDIRD